MMNSSYSRNIIAAFLLGLIAGFLVSLVNGKELLSSFFSGCLFAIIVTIIVLALTWASEVAIHKGYDQWVGILLVLIFNIIGIIVLIILPTRKPGNE